MHKLCIQASAMRHCPKHPKIPGYERPLQAYQSSKSVGSCHYHCDCIQSAILDSKNERSMPRVRHMVARHFPNGGVQSVVWFHLTTRLMQASYCQHASMPAGIERTWPLCWPALSIEARIFWLEEHLSHKHTTTIPMASLRDSI